MLVLQLASFSIVTLFVVFRTLGQPEPGLFLARLALFSAASWIAEESCILLYNFYSYNPALLLFLGHVPVLVILIWPIIIHSAWDLASQFLQPGHRHIPLAAAAIVCTDASFIEPMAVNAGLWSWNEPGIFDAPPIGILGWAYFTFLCVFLFEHGRRRNRVKQGDLLVLALPVFGTHLLLLGSWWGALRWVNAPVGPTLAVGGAWAISLLLVCTFLGRRRGTHLERKTLLLRLPAAILFFALLIANPSSSAMLVVYAIAFVPPYITLMAQQYLGHGKFPTFEKTKR